jgi:hypothetical protein
VDAADDDDGGAGGGVADDDKGCSGSPAPFSSMVL